VSILTLSSTVASPGRAPEHARHWQSTALRTVWFGIVPGLATYLVFRYLLVPPALASGTPIALLARLGNQHAVVFGVALYLVFAGLCRYWAYRLPGRSALLGLPEEVAERVPEAELRALVEAAALRRLLARATRLRQKLLSPERDAELGRCLGELDVAMGAGNAARVERASAGARSVGAPVLGRWRLRELVATLIAVAAAAGLAFGMRGLVFESLEVSKSSMLPNLSSGVRVGVNKLARARTPRRGDVIVFPDPNGGERMVKRVVGLPGDRIRMRAGHPVINGWDVPSCDAGTYFFLGAEGTVQGRLEVEFLGQDPYLTLHTPSRILFDDGYLVQAGEVFVLGDNRNESVDSRIWNDRRGGGVPIGNIGGRVDWFLVGTRRSGAVDFSRFFRHIGLRPGLEGLDTMELERGIERCLKNRPSQTDPPAPPSG
jgi:signal peptidase I